MQNQKKVFLVSHQNLIVEKSVYQQDDDDASVRAVHTDKANSFAHREEAQAGQAGRQLWRYDHHIQLLVATGANLLPADEPVVVRDGRVENSDQA